MEQRDWLQRQIDQLGIFLANLIAGLHELRSRKKAYDATEITYRALKDEINLDLDEVIDLDPDELVSYLQNRKFNNNSLNQLAELLLFVADEIRYKETEVVRSRRYYEKSLIIFEYLNKTDTTYSLDRVSKIEKIKNVL